MRSILSKPRREGYKISQLYPGFLQTMPRFYRVPDIVLFRALEIARRNGITCSSDMIYDAVHDFYSRISRSNPVLRSILIQAARNDPATFRKIILPVILKLKEFPNAFQ